MYIGAAQSLLRWRPSGIIAVISRVYPVTWSSPRPYPSFRPDWSNRVSLWFRDADITATGRVADDPYRIAPAIPLRRWVPSEFHSRSLSCGTLGAQCLDPISTLLKVDMRFYNIKFFQNHLYHCKTAFDNICRTFIINVTIEVAPIYNVKQ